MSRITAESIREQMQRLRSQLERLEDFNTHGFTPEKCSGEHDWTAIDSEHDYNAWFSVMMNCRKCGTVEWWNYKYEDSAEEDPWSDLRPEEPEEEQE